MEDYVNIKVVVNGATTFYPRGFYYKGSGAKTKLVLVGDDRLNTYDKRTFDLKDCDIYLSKINRFGDKFEL